jgi:dephospho-CoA kinase
MILVAITGSIGCGKTTISDILRHYGFVVHDVDKWVKLLYHGKDFLNVIKKRFPESFEEGYFNKRTLRNIVFNNPDKLKILEGLIHPFLLQKLRKYIRKNKTEGIVFVDLALLFEMHWERYFKYVILADVSYEEQKKRVMKRDHITAEDFEKINQKQISQQLKKELVDFVINTDVSKGMLIKRIFEILGEIK